MVTQGSTEFTANEMVFWGGQSGDEARLTVYMDGDARISEPGRTVCRPYLMAELATSTSVKFLSAPPSIARWPIR